MCLQTYVVYKKRYFILFLVSALQFITAFQTIEYTIIANIIARYYNVSYESVLITAIISAIVDAALIFPMSWIVKHFGIRNVFIASCFLDCSATILKCFTVNDTKFWLILLAQTLDGIAFTGITTLNIQISRVWFPQNEIARASTISLLANTVGGFASSFIPVALVPNVKNKPFIANGLCKLFIGQAVISFSIFSLSLFFFEEKPKTPPSKAENDVQELRENQSFIQQIKSALNVNLVAISIAFGMVSVTKGALNIMFNQMLVKTFNNNLYWVSLVAILFAISKIIGGYCAGHFLDVTHRYKQLLLLMAPITCFMFALFGVAFYINSRVLILMAPVLIGLSYGPFNPTFMNFAAEVTYPAPESITSAVIFFIGEIFIAFSILFSWIQTKYGNVTTVTVMGSSVAVVFVIISFVKSDLRRQNIDDERSALIIRPRLNSVSSAGFSIL